MRIAYLVLTHAEPEHLERLIAALSSQTALFYVHVDANVDETAFERSKKPGVVFCKTRVACAWGHISLVDATLELARLALAGPPCDYYVLLSGSCYPVQPPAYIERFLTQNAGTEFLQAFPFPDARFGKRLERLTGYYIKRSRPFAGLKWRMQKLLQVLPARDYRTAFEGLELATGSQWWALTGDALRHVLSFTASNPRALAFCRHIDCPDEFVFQLALWNSPFRAALGHSLTFTDWPPGSHSPATLDAVCLDAFRRSPVLDSERHNAPDATGEVLFARKFVDRSRHIVAAVDDIIEGKRVALESRGPQASVIAA